MAWTLSIAAAATGLAGLVLLRRRWRAAHREQALQALRQRYAELDESEILEHLAAHAAVELIPQDGPLEAATLMPMGSEDRRFFNLYAAVVVAGRRYAPSPVGDLVHLCTVGEGRALIALGGTLYEAEAESGDLTPAELYSVPRLALLHAGVGAEPHGSSDRRPTTVRLAGGSA